LESFASLRVKIDNLFGCTIRAKREACSLTNQDNNDNWDLEWMKVFRYLFWLECKRLVFIVTSAARIITEWAIEQLHSVLFICVFIFESDDNGKNMTQYQNLLRRTYSEFVTKPWSNIREVVVENLRALFQPFSLLISHTKGLITSSQKRSI